MLFNHCGLGGGLRPWRLSPFLTPSLGGLPLRLFLERSKLVQETPSGPGWVSGGVVYFLAGVASFLCEPGDPGHVDGPSYTIGNGEEDGVGDEILDAVVVPCASAPCSCDHHLVGSTT